LNKGAREKTLGARKEFIKEHIRLLRLNKKQLATKNAMNRYSPELAPDLKEQGAEALLAATFEFLLKNKIKTKAIIDFARKYNNPNKPGHRLHLYKNLVRTYDDMGVIMATWFSDPKFLDGSGQPLPLAVGPGQRSIQRLIRVSGAKVRLELAIELMQQSPSIKLGDDGKMVAVRRVFVLPKFEVPRAAFVVERYFQTLMANVAGRRRGTPLLLERSCYVSAVHLAKLTPTLRDIDHRGTAFMDSIDGEIENLRIRRPRRRPSSEVGVLVFAWTKPDRHKKLKKKC
jgi:hypothetical protein